ncbi:SOUL family heme-binding protein [Rheinheimera baltica]|uniref:Heme-binding protein n=1 Tax=Rheinheimera baltica TaxID=67576 RepID=A0ABT9I6D4_9GAMM|nr:heme-binding protein [Rheinheimera baltica]MDP5138526.1 heme-binding protein [Rheinheimera baltica]MDP5151723.1 heme-binding protein [Rheinheimera baltica]MDP5190859.1 heme-binding protein [Rheinheimera baltica]
MKVLLPRVWLPLFAALFATGCSVFGKNNVETAPYTLLKADSSQNIEVRNYDAMVLVSADMSGDGRNSAFRKLFKYIGGENEAAVSISMTAPVIMDNNSKGEKIAMTAPVLMNNRPGDSMMSFVMPKEFTLQTTPKPTNPDLVVTELNDYKVAAIQFSGTLSRSNVAKHTELLQAWLSANGYTAKSAPIEAGYNGPLTLPMLRRNEVLIEIN